MVLTEIKLTHDPKEILCTFLNAIDAKHYLVLCNLYIYAVESEWGCIT